MFKRLFATVVEQQQTIPSTVNQSLDGLSTVVSTTLCGHFHATELASLNWLHTMAPCFPVRAEQIKIIYKPDEFYQNLLIGCRTAKRRIMFASLYLGTGKLETGLVNEIHENMKSNPDLKVNILLDYTRGTRGETNSRTQLQPLLSENRTSSTGNCLVSFYHTPVLQGLAKKFIPPRWNELVGLQHMKLYLFDDTVIVSGANLSNDYFTNRQDRYFMITDSALSNFYSNLIRKVQEFSLRITETDVKLHDNWSHLPYDCNRHNFASEAKQRIGELFNRSIEEQTDRQDTADTWIFPLIEMGQLNIHHDSYVTRNLLSKSLPGSVLKLATGYFNLTQNYMDTITNDCPADCSILMAHPNANGFQGAKFPAGGIPAAYSLIAKKFYDKLVESKQDHRVNLFEYEKSCWTYHAKGLWYFLPKSNLPNLTLIGSSNFGERSVNRDLEAQICLVTTDKRLQEQLKLECDRLYELGTVAEKELLVRPIPKWVRCVVSLFRNFF